ncbi:MAG: holo-ACP synthase [Acidimicrobiales bacterium]
MPGTNVTAMGEDAAHQLLAVSAAGRTGVCVGVDVVEVGRFRRVMERRGGLAARLFTPGELAYAARFADPAPQLAARFAAKEAAMKALGVGLGAVSFREVEVARAESGEPALVLSARSAKLAQERGVVAWALSLTHTALVAAAVVVGIPDPSLRR